MAVNPHTDTQDYQLDEPLAPKRTRFEEFWRLFKQNRLAIAGMAFFILFFVVAIIGLALTSGNDPFLDPALVRLQEKLRPPLARPNLEMLKPNEVPTLGVYLLGTDDLGRDVFARMLQGSWVSLTVGFVAVGIAIIIGIFLGGIAGYYGHRHIQINQLIVGGFLVAGLLLILFGLFWAGIVLLICSSGILGLWSHTGRPILICRRNIIIRVREYYHCPVLLRRQWFRIQRKEAM